MGLSQADQTRFRWVRISTASITRQSAPGVGLLPDIIMTPYTVSKMATTGLLLQLQAPASSTPAVPVAGGFTITVWLLDPVTGRWSAFDDIVIDYKELFVSFDIDASQLWFQVTGIALGGDGDIDFGIAEQ